MTKKTENKKQKPIHKFKNLKGLINSSFKQLVHGEYTANARIVIDYSNSHSKPKVSFSYPDLPNQVRSSMFYWICMIWFLFVILFLEVGWFIDTVEVFYHNYIQSKTAASKFGDCVKHYTDNYDYIVANTCYKEVGTGFQYSWSFMPRVGNNTAACVINNTGAMVPELFVKPILVQSIWQVFFYLCIFIGFPCLFYFPFRRFWNGRVYPVWNAWLHRMSYVFVKPKDVQKVNYGDGLGWQYIFEVPLYDNVRLKYNATKDFSRYLTRFEIHEHPFYYLKLKSAKELRGEMRKAKQKKFKVRLQKPCEIVDKRGKKKIINEFMWRARFTFSKKPEKGVLEIMFK